MRRAEKRTWLVYSPTYYIGYHSGPDSGERDMEVVVACTYREAIIRAVRILLCSTGWNWAKENRSDGCPPWKGFRAAVMEGEYVPSA